MANLVKSTAASTIAPDTIDWTDVPVRRADYLAEATIFAQGEPADSVMYVEDGTVGLSVVSQTGKEAVIAILEPWHFFGEGCLAGQRRRMSTAAAIGPCTISIVDKSAMSQHLHSHPAFAGQFLGHVLTRNIRIEEDIIDHLFNSSEKRLARTLLLLARYGEPDVPHRVLPRLSQETLAEMVGTTRSRVNFFMNKFRRLGFIDYDNAGLTIKSALLGVVLRD